MIPHDFIRPYYRRKRETYAEAAVAIGLFVLCVGLLMLEQVFYP